MQSDSVAREGRPKRLNIAVDGKIQQTDSIVLHLKMPITVGLSMRELDDGTEVLHLDLLPPDQDSARGPVHFGSVG